MHRGAPFETRVDTAGLQGLSEIQFPSGLIVSAWPNTSRSNNQGQMPDCLVEPAARGRFGKLPAQVGVPLPPPNILHSIPPVPGDLHVTENS